MVYHRPHADRRLAATRRGLGFESLESRQLLTSMPWGADPQDTGEFMLGRVLVSLVLFESDGSHDANREDWTSETIEQVKKNVQEGLQWWEDLLAEQDSVHELDFRVDFTFADEPIQTGYEPISRPSDDFVLWIEDFFEQADVPDGSSYSDRIFQFNHAQRLKHDTNWAFTILVVNSEIDSDGRFDPSGSFSQSFAFAGGRFFVTTSERPASTHAHETAHMFWALDEYSGSRPYSEERGYYRVQNRNAADDHPDPDSRVDSIMDSHVIAYPKHAVSPSALEMIGWRDSDRDGIFDVLDVPHALTGEGEFLADESVYRFRGESQVGALPNLNPSGRGHDITLNQITHVEVRFDPGADWQIVDVEDEYRAELDLRLTVPEGAGRIEIRTVDARSGVTSPTFQDELLPTAASWQNPRRVLDVSGDDLVSPIDALLVINELNLGGPRPLPPRPIDDVLPPFLDSNGDGFLSAVDALLVINELNHGGSGDSSAEGGDLLSQHQTHGEGESSGSHVGLGAAAVDASFSNFPTVMGRRSALRFGSDDRSIRDEPFNSRPRTAAWDDCGADRCRSSHILSISRLNAKQPSWLGKPPALAAGYLDQQGLIAAIAFPGSNRGEE